MSCSNRFVELDKSLHDRAGFCCGENELDVFIQTRALKHMHAGISRTMVLPANHPFPDGKRPICAFYTITASSVSRKTLPEKLAKKLPSYPIPVFLIAQLAVHQEFKGKGLGKVTLIKALEHLYEINKHMRAYAVVVDCLNNDVAAFYQQYGFELLTHHGGRDRLFLPMKTVKELFDEN